ncbi:hypothetical protein I553_4340 [Mycobacterium xenopi 4042]|uniref:Uncharacterized protein n=1 Tax=Mycobacterium xenopi 4042 TaxID=1299334 RepID=X8AEX8_MYCXE|nr:hypothetical protein I553_4340 [Mycobacterium xenopi 4042]
MLATSPGDGGGVHIVIQLVELFGHQVRIGVVGAALDAGIGLAWSGQPERVRSSVSSRSSSSGARRTCTSLSKAQLSLKSRSSRLPNSLNGMMSVTSLRSRSGQRSADPRGLRLQETGQNDAGSTWKVLGS